MWTMSRNLSPFIKHNNKKIEKLGVSIIDINQHKQFLRLYVYKRSSIKQTYDANRNEMLHKISSHCIREKEIGHANFMIILK